MAKLKDITGLRFGKLLVLGHKKAKNYERTLRECLCDCGNISYRTIKYLYRAKIPSCGKCIKNSKKCPKCRIDKPFGEYNKCKDNKDGLSSRCRSCAANFYQENKEIIRSKYLATRDAKRSRRKEISKKSREKRRLKNCEYKKEYSQRAEVKERKKKAHLVRKNNDVAYNIKRRLRWRIRDAVKRIKGSGFKYESSLVILGCDMEFFKEYLEGTFKDGINWDNISEWHIDHIKPCAKFDLTSFEEQKKCFHYSNLQALWSIDNIKKSDHYQEPPLVK